MSKLYQVNLSYASFGILVISNEVINTAPIGAWMNGKSLDFVRAWVENKNGTITLLRDEEDAAALK